MSALRDLPAVDRVFRNLQDLEGYPSELVKDEIRAVLQERRKQLQNGAPVETTAVEQEVATRLHRLRTPSLRRVVNATGVILHTNLGRAPLPVLDSAAGYSNLEYNLETGKRGKRDDLVSPLLLRLLNKPAIVVNNNAAAVFLILNELAGGGEVIVSRGELIEIGDGFRIPEIMARSGAILREVGTTNRTRIDDYRFAINERTRLIMRVHPSNFHVSGFTSRPSLAELAALGRESGIAVYEDLGSGSLTDLSAVKISEPVAAASLAAGINLISFSCDKLLGGPQAGIIAGDRQLTARVRRNPLYRAFRVDKLIFGALAVTLQHHLARDWKKIPALRMILASSEELRGRAERLKQSLTDFECELRQNTAVIGGGSTPDKSLPTWVLEVTVPDVARFEQRLRHGAVPVIARVSDNKLILDMRTVADEEEPMLVESMLAAAR